MKLQKSRSMGNYRMDHLYSLRMTTSNVAGRASTTIRSKQCELIRCSVGGTSRRAMEVPLQQFIHGVKLAEICAKVIPPTVSSMSLGVCGQ